MLTSLTPNPLTGTAKRSMKAWLIAQLEAEELANNTDLPATSTGLAVYINGEAKIVTSGYWNAQDLLPISATRDYRVHVGHYRPSTPGPTKPERIAVLGAIIGAVGLWDELATQYSRALGRVILEAYNSCCFDMLQAPQPVVKLAFSANKQSVAVQYVDDAAWYQNNGAPVEIDESWHVVNA